MDSLKLSIGTGLCNTGGYLMGMAGKNNVLYGAAFAVAGALTKQFAPELSLKEQRTRVWTSVYDVGWAFAATKTSRMELGGKNHSKILYFKMSSLGGVLGKNIGSMFDQEYIKSCFDRNPIASLLAPIFMVPVALLSAFVALMVAIGFHKF